MTVQISTRTALNLRYPPRRATRGFTLIDLLVSVAVIALLIGIMLPTLVGVRETARKVVCMSNVRQVSLAMGMYADTYRSELPPSRSYSKSLSDPTFDPRLLMAARLSSQVGGPGASFDGLGLLHHLSFGVVPGIFYCPSHRGETRLTTYAAQWGDTPGMVFTNYSYRGGSARGVTRLDRLPGRIALISDGLASDDDFNHNIGANVAWSDQSVVWFADAGGDLVKNLPDQSNEALAQKKVLDAWQLLDRVESAQGDPDEGE
jgi:type II secretory pathway pseudopilin PulG